MGPFRTGRFQQFIISHQRTWQRPTTNETNEYTPTSGRFGYDKTCQETFDWRELEYSDEDDLDETY
jgi:hypothetical protein